MPAMWRCLGTALNSLPKISVVTPNFNQAGFVERTLRSVLDQRYPALEYIVMDGGSTDGSQALIARYADRLAHVQSGPDQGQYDAITQGFAQATGDVMGWINSDDIHLPWTLQTVGEIFRDCPDVQWITSLTQPQIGETDAWTGAAHLAGASKESFLAGCHTGTGFRNIGYIQQEGTFWRRSLWEAAGAVVGRTCPLAGDFELWAEFFAQAEIACVAQPLAAFRSRPGQRSEVHAGRYAADVARALAAAQSASSARPDPRRTLAHGLYTLMRRKPRPLVQRLGYTMRMCLPSATGWRTEARAFL